MKAKQLAAALAVVGLTFGVSACSEDEATVEETTAAPTDGQDAAPAQMPTAEELNAVLMRAADPNLPINERVHTVQGGEQVPELFDKMSQSQQESGAQFQVVDPVLPGYTANSVLATVSFTRPDAEQQLAQDVEFVHEDGAWKISQSWACFLISNTLPAEEVPAMCMSNTPAEAPAPDAPANPEAPAPAPGGEVPMEAPVEEQFQEAPAL
ncbi:hypothetical protein A0K93_10170 [Corynebacterium sp. BCW_4722]|nr:hypothetical protein A0K93_10170 [Corynebacterium sp. BCW_4722]